MAGATHRTGAPPGRDPSVWRVLASRVGHALRHDWTAGLLVVTNIVPVLSLWLSGEPVAAILVVYWLQLVAIGVWTLPRIVLVARSRAGLPLVCFAVGYCFPVYLFGLISGGLIDNQMQGTQWHQDFSLWRYAAEGGLFFAYHGLSFFVCFLRRREFRERDPIEVMLGAVLRVTPMAGVALIGGFVAAFFDSATALALLVVPAKTLVDLLGHVVDHTPPGQTAPTTCGPGH